MSILVLNVLNVLLHKVFLKSNLITGPMVVEVRPSLPVRKVGLILGNDLTGGKVVLQAHMSPAYLTVDQTRKV